MIADAHFTIGLGHLVCQDYALAGSVGGRWVALVSDGCSSSPDTDLGARILARSFLAAVLDGLAVDAAVERSLDTAQAVAERLGLPEDSLDATLCGWIVENEVAHGFIHGDGVLAFRTAAGVEIHHATQAANAPDYPNYRKNHARALAHHSAYGCDTSISVLGSEPGVVTVRGGYHAEISLAQTLMVAAFSDGVATVHNGGRTLPVGAVVESLTQFPQLSGAFFHRRVRRQIKDWAKDGLAPTDDLAGAVLVT